MAKNASMEEFEALLNDSLEIDTPSEGSVVRGKVIAIEAGQAIIDVGYKMEGRVDLKEFANPGEEASLKIGDEVEVYLDRVENARGEASISREKARREEAWDRLEQAYAKEERVDGAIFGRVKGGFTVDLGGAVAFLPGSQVDVRPVRDAGPLMGLKQPFQILKMDRRRGNIVVSRRAILEESRAEQRADHHRERTAREAEADHHAGREVEAHDGRGLRHPGETRGIEQRAEAQHPHRTEAVGDTAGERLHRAP